MDRHNNDHLRVAPCCQANSRIEPVESFDFYTSPYLQELREKFNQGQKPPECSWCWRVEDVGHESRRQSAMKFFQLAKESREVKLESIDYSATWACNLSCIMCGPLFSSRWATEIDASKDHLREMGRLFQKNNNFLDRFDTQHVKKVHFNGGEPMLNDDQTTLLERLDRQGTLKNALISYNTNGTIMPSDRILDLWSRARVVRIYFSIDATGSAFEYIRYPGNWDDTAKNISDMKNNLPENVLFGLNITVGSYNILDLSSLYDWFQRDLASSRHGHDSDFCWQFAFNYDPAQLTKEIKQHAIQDLCGIPQYQGVVAYLNDTLDRESDQSWTISLDQIDLRRGTNWRESLAIGKYY